MEFMAKAYLRREKKSNVGVGNFSSTANPANNLHKRTLFLFHRQEELTVFVVWIVLKHDLS